MIKIEVEPYCENCMRFEPVTTKTNVIIGNYIAVRCEKRDICSRMYEYMIEQADAEKEKDGANNENNA